MNQPRSSTGQAPKMGLRKRSKEVFHEHETDPYP